MNERATTLRAVCCMLVIAAVMGMVWPPTSSSASARSIIDRSSSATVDGRGATAFDPPAARASFGDRSPSVGSLRALPVRRQQQASATPTTTSPPTPNPSDTASPAPTDRPSATSTQRSTPTLAPTETPRATATRTMPPTSSTTTSASPTRTADPAADVDRPILVIDRVHVDPDRPAAGQTFGLDVDVANEGETAARDVRFGWSSEVFVPDRSSTEIFKERIEPGEERDFEFRLRVTTGTPAGSYPIQVTLSWRSEDGDREQLETQIAVEVVGGGPRLPQVVVAGSQVPGVVAPGVAFTAAFQLRNTGGDTARNLVMIPAAGPLTLDGTGAARPLDIPAGGVATVGLRLIAVDPAEPGAAQQTFELRYDDPQGERYTDQVAVGLRITADAAYGPLPLVTRYDAGGRLHPGQTFDLELEVTNVGVAAARRAVMVLGGGVPTSQGGAGAGSLGPFAPLDNSNRRFLDVIEAGASMTVRQRMVVDGAAKPGVYVVDVAFSYADGDGEMASSSEVITLLVSRAVDLQITPLQPVTSTIMGRPVEFAVELINAGTEEVDVGSARIVPGDAFRAETTPRFVGPLDAGAADLVEARLIPRRVAQDASVDVVVTYTDDFNQMQAITETFRFVIEEPPPPPTSGEMEPTSPPRSILVRVLRGLLGLGASPAPPPSSGEIIQPVDEPPPDTGDVGGERERAVPIERAPTDVGADDG